MLYLYSGRGSTQASHVTEAHKNLYSLFISAPKYYWRFSIRKRKVLLLRAIRLRMELRPQSISPVHLVSLYDYLALVATEHDSPTASFLDPSHAKSIPTQISIAKSFSTAAYARLFLPRKDESDSLCHP